MVALPAGPEGGGWVEGASGGARDEGCGLEERASTGGCVDSLPLGQVGGVFGVCGAGPGVGKGGEAAGLGAGASF